ncbi:MAG: hypothetical protein V1867_00975 [Candidatus Falkowbacteria bacterium]
MANNNNKNNQPPAGGEGGENKAGDNKSGARKKNLTRVRFNRAHTPYLKGETAGLEPELAKKLIEAKVCSKV